MPDAAPNEVGILHHDVLLIHHVCQTVMDEHLLTIETADDRRYHIIVGDLWRKHVDHCQGVAILLGQGLIDPATVVQRAAYETAITLLYLMTVGDKKRNARLFEAYMIVDTTDVFANRPPGSDEKARRALATIPDDILREVRDNRKARRPWSGKNLAEMAEALKISGHREVYAGLSWEAHARMAGLGIERLEHASGKVEMRFGSSAKPHHFEVVANHTRRMLHYVYAIVTREVYGMTPRLATTSPFERNRQGFEPRT